MDYIDLTPFIMALLAVVAAIVMSKVLPWIASKTTANQQQIIKSVVRTLVFAAEQVYGSGKGAEKLDYVIAELQKRGFTADRAEIEAAVFEYLNQAK